MHAEVAMVCNCRKRCDECMLRSPWFATAGSGMGKVQGQIWLVCCGWLAESCCCCWYPYMDVWIYVGWVDDDDDAAAVHVVMAVKGFDMRGVKVR